MKLFIITGSSSGIGKSLASLALSLGYHVLGVSRNSTIVHDFYTHIHCDLSNHNETSSLNFPSSVNQYDAIYLINNAGTVGEIIPLSLKSNDAILNEYQVNIISPTVLSKKFIEAYKSLLNKDLKIINISSGAAKSNIDGWSTYNASKAAINQLTITLQNEMDIYKYPIKCFAIAPGVVNTNMQEIIRRTELKNFSKSDYFKGLYLNNDLVEPDVCSEYLMDVLLNTIKPNSIVFTLKDYYV